MFTKCIIIHSILREVTATIENIFKRHSIDFQISKFCEKPQRHFCNVNARHERLAAGQATQ